MLVLKIYAETQHKKDLQNIEKKEHTFIAVNYRVVFHTAKAAHRALLRGRLVRPKYSKFVPRSFSH